MQNEEQNNQFYNQDNSDPYSSTAIQQNDDSQGDDPQSLSWTASEFIQHDKNMMWYVGLAALTVLLALTAFFLLNRDVFSLVIILVLGVVFGIAASRKPRILQYTLDEHGLLMGDKSYDYDSFRSFSVLDEGSIFTLVLMPVQRFSPILTIYVPEDMIDKAAEIVGIYLPIVNHQPGAIDKFLSRIRF